MTGTGEAAGSQYATELEIKKTLLKGKVNHLRNPGNPVRVLLMQQRQVEILRMDSEVEYQAGLDMGKYLEYRLESGE